MYNELVAIVGKEWVREAEAVADYGIDGMMPKAVVLPDSVEELADILRRAHEARWAVVPAGYGTGLGLGHPPDRFDLVIATTRLNRILDYEPADLTASVEAGCSLEVFNRTVGEQGQWLPLNPPVPEHATLGAVAAAEDFGSLRHGYGLPRDYVIGLQVIQADGTVITTGGRVVKNVAGYDLNKLFVGSLGTLGIVTRLNVKLRPRPETEATGVLLSSRLEALHTAAFALHASQLHPAAVSLLSPSAMKRCGCDFGAGRYGLLVRFMASASVVNSQIDRLREIAARNQGEIGRLNESSVWRALADLPKHVEPDVILRASVLPSEVVAIFKELENGLKEFTDESCLVAQHGCGVILGHMRLNAAQPLHRLVDALRRWRTSCRQQLVLERAPVELKRAVDVWGDVGPTLSIMRALKEKFDPRRILNPGRFVGGI
jgi:glycolate oxidase FAD binding subunit